MLKQSQLQHKFFSLQLCVYVYVCVQAATLEKDVSWILVSGRETSIITSKTLEVISL